MEERASNHDEEVSIEEDQAMVNDEIVDTSMLTGLSLELMMRGQRLVPPMLTMRMTTRKHLMHH